MVISRKSALPLYHQLREFLRDKIEGGEWEPGHQLPGEGDLQSEFGVSRATVRQALQLLENDGLIERIQGKGTFVGRPKIASDLMAMFTNEALIRDPGSNASFHLLHIKQVSSPAGVAAALNLPAREKVYEIKRTIFVDDEDLMLITSWLPASLVPGLETKGIGETSLWRTLRGHYSLEIGHQHREVQVTILDEEEAEALGGRPGAPAMLLTYLNSSRTGNPLEYRKVIVRGDRCKYVMDLDTPELTL
jgi:GntR family transcriptional regulator, N-acetylglucosamine utilization regulator